MTLAIPENTSRPAQSPHTAHAEPAAPPSGVLSTVEQDTLRFHAINARSENTNRAYARQWDAWTEWCAANGFSAFPAQAPVVVLYLDSLVKRGLRASTVDQTVAAIKAVLSDNDHAPGATAALSGLSSTRFLNAVASLHRVIGANGGGRVKKPRAFTQGEVMTMAVACPASPQGVQDRALLLLGVNAGMRGSEHVALTVGDVAFDDAGAEVFIARSKTDQDALGESIYVGRLPTHQHHLDPVAALEQHITKNRAEASPDAPLFIAYRKGGVKPHHIHGEEHGLTREAVSAAVARCARRAHIPETTAPVSSHSLRHTFITQSFKQGVPQVDIARTSRHKNMSVLAGYDQQTTRETVVSPRLWS